MLILVGFGRVEVFRNVDAGVMLVCFFKINLIPNVVEVLAKTMTITLHMVLYAIKLGCLSWRVRTRVKLDG